MIVEYSFDQVPPHELDREQFGCFVGTVYFCNCILQASRGLSCGKNDVSVDLERRRLHVCNKIAEPFRLKDRVGVVGLTLCSEARSGALQIENVYRILALATPPVTLESRK